MSETKEKIIYIRKQQHNYWWAGWHKQ